MSESAKQLPLLPLVLAGAPPGLRQALAQEGIAHVDRAASPTAGRFVLFDSRAGRAPHLAASQIAIDIDSLRRAVASDPFEDLLDERSAGCHYTIGSHEYREEIARIDKRQVRRRLMAALRRMLEARGGIWLRLAAYPFPYRSVFNLRCNYHTAEGMAAALDEVAGREAGSSHFLCGTIYEEAPDALKSLAGLDIGTLGYHRVVRDDVEGNVDNLRLGMTVLRRAGLDPRGYASPHGRFTLPLLSAIEVLRLEHSSSFALAYDELPLLSGSGRVVQIPTHPIAVGRLPGDGRSSPGDPRAAAAAAADLAEYFVKLVAARYQAGEPLLLFRRATPYAAGQRLAVDALFDAVARCGALWRATLTDWAAWWRSRADVRLRVIADGERFGVTFEGGDGSHRLAAEYWRGEHVALLPLDQKTTWFSPEALGFQSRRATAELPTPRRVDGPQLPRRMGRRWVSETSRDDSGVHAFRDWMQRTLGRLRP